MRISESLSSYARSADTHGLRFIVDTNISSARRSVWAILVFGSVVFLSFFFYVRVSRYLRYDVTTVMTSSRRKLHTMPVVSLCVPPDQAVAADRLTVHDIVNGRSAHVGDIGLRNVTRRTHGKYYLKEEALNFLVTWRNDFNNTDLLATDLARQFLRVEEIKHYYKDGVFVPNNGAWESATKHWIALLNKVLGHNYSDPVQDPTDYDLREVMNRAAVTVNDMFVDCFWTRYDIGATVEGQECNSMWKTELSIGSVCFYNKNMNNSAMQLGLLFRPEKFGLGCVNPGYYAVLRLRDEQDTLTDYGGKDYDTYVMDKTMVNLWADKIVTSTRENPPYHSERCGTAGDLTHNKSVYSTRRCVAECIADIQLAEDGCREIGLPGGGKECPYFKNMFEKNRHKGYRRCEASCRVPCSQRQFVLGSHVNNKFMVAGMTWVDVDSDVVSEVVLMSEVPVMELASMLGELGGMMGLFLGISILSVVHFLQTLGHMAFLTCCRGGKERLNLKPADDDC